MVITKVPAFKQMPPTNPFLNDTNVEFGDQEKCCLFLINHGANVNGRNNTNSTGWTPLHTALSKGYDRIGESLIKFGANINAVANSSGSTPLHTTYRAGAHLWNGCDNMSYF